MCRGNRKRDITTMVTYSHATTPLGQSERAYYLNYFIKLDGDKELARADDVSKENSHFDDQS